MVTYSRLSLSKVVRTLDVELSTARTARALGVSEHHIRSRLPQTHFMGWREPAKGVAFLHRVAKLTLPEISQRFGISQAAAARAIATVEAERAGAA